MPNFIKKIKKQPLLGHVAHALFAPSYRPYINTQAALARQPKRAGVGIIIFPQEQHHVLVLIQRTQHPNDPHSGQVSFPGGRLEPNESLLQCAIRECWEEIGVALSLEECCRELSPIYIPPSDFMVYPFVFYLDHAPDFKLQDAEVEHLLFYRLKDLQQLSLPPKEKVFSASRGTQVPYFEVDGSYVWGATAMILSELYFLLKNP